MARIKGVWARSTSVSHVLRMSSEHTERCPLQAMIRSTTRRWTCAAPALEVRTEWRSRPFDAVA